MLLMDGDFVSRLLMILATYPDLDLKNNVPVAFSQSYGGNRTISDHMYVIQIGFSSPMNHRPQRPLPSLIIVNDNSAHTHVMCRARALRQLAVAVAPCNRCCLARPRPMVHRPSWPLPSSVAPGDNGGGTYTPVMCRDSLFCLLHRKQINCINHGKNHRSHRANPPRIVYWFAIQRCLLLRVFLEAHARSCPV